MGRFFLPVPPAERKKKETLFMSANIDLTRVVWVGAKRQLWEFLTA